jgi:hypothetical protein
MPHPCNKTVITIVYLLENGNKMGEKLKAENVL